MTMSATTAVAVLVVMSTTATIVTAFTFAMMMTTAVTATCQHLDGLVDLLLSSIAVFTDKTCEIERLAS